MHSSERGCQRESVFCDIVTEGQDCRLPCEEQGPSSVGTATVG